MSDTVSAISSPRILAVQASPADAVPKTTIRYTALVVDQNGVVQNAPVEWAYCNARNPLANLGPVSDVCVQASADQLLPIGAGPQATGAIPDIACRQFGPEVPQATGNQPAGRPVDPDTTGGYYQPVTAVLPGGGGDVVVVEEVRLSCGIDGATPEQASDFGARYRFNVNPQIASLSAGGNPWASDDTGATNPVAVGQKIDLQVTWPTCPVSDACGDGVCGPDETTADCAADCATPNGCPGAERYVHFDLRSKAVEDVREGIHVSWYATGGSFDLDRTGRDGTDPATEAGNGWRAPAQPGPVHLWVVVRDDRGGTGWAGYALEVK